MFPSCPPDDTTQGHWDHFHGAVHKTREIFLCLSDLCFQNPRLCWLPALAQCPVNPALAARISPVVVILVGILCLDRWTDLEKDELPQELRSSNRFVCSKFGDIFGGSFSSGSFSFNSQNSINEEKRLPARLKHGPAIKGNHGLPRNKYTKRNSLFGLGF